MASKMIRLSFPVEYDDVYDLIKANDAPAKFVAQAVRFFCSMQEDGPCSTIPDEQVLSIQEQIEEGLNKRLGLIKQEMFDSLKRELQELFSGGVNTQPIISTPVVLSPAMQKAASMFSLDE